MVIKINQTEELKILRKLITITNSELDLNLILQEIVNIVSEISKADSVFIYLLDNKKECLVLKASKIPHTSILNKINLKLGEGITGWVAKKNEPVLINCKAYNDSRFKNFDVIEEDKFEAFLSVPIISKGNVIGVINVQHKEPHKYSKSVVDLITTISKQVGGVIENAELYEDAKTKALQFDSLVKISESISSEKYLDEILNLIVVVISEMLNSKICSIMLVDDKEETLIMKATKSLSNMYMTKPPVTLKGSLSGEVIKNKKVKIVDDVTNEEKYIYSKLAVKEGLTSMVLIPMIVKNKSIGIINIYTKNYYKFTIEETNVLQIIANQAAVTIENTKLVEDAIKSKEALITRKIIERAKREIMQINGFSEEIAHRWLTKKSMDSGKSMKEISEALLLMADLKK